MVSYLSSIVAFAISLALVLATTPLVRQLGLATGQLDRPNARKIHARPIVRIGGVAICGSTCTALLIIWGLQGFGVSFLAGELGGLLAGSFAFFLIGIADDLFNLPPTPRLVMQLGVASIVWLVGVRVEFITVPIVGITSLGWLSLPITVIWLVGVVNAINWIDGMDGLAAGVTAIASAIAAIVCLSTSQPLPALIAAALAGANCGFLRYNYNPAKIFMGDGGSYFIGFTLAGVAVIGLVKTATFTAIVLPYLILAVPIVDMLAVVVARVRDRQSPFLADQRHLHHRLLQAGLPIRLAVGLVYALTLWCGSLAMTLAGTPSSLVFVLGATMLLCYTGWRAWKAATIG